MRHLFSWIIVLTLVAGWAPAGICHGVAGSIDPEHGYQITAMYDDGEPMSYAAVEVKAPDSEVAFQTGRTDRNGVMMFQPDRPGRWQAVVSDGMGHRLEVATVVVAESPGNEPPAKQAPAMVRPGGSRTQGIITGLAVIFGLFGLSYGWRIRRRHQRSA